MQQLNAEIFSIKIISKLTLTAVIAIATGVIGDRSFAQTEIPKTHKGLAVVTLGVIPEISLKAQNGISGFKLRMREITIRPGGQIAKHSHAKKPGLVTVTSGTWTEGRPGAERDYSSSEPKGILEDSATVHWFWNRNAKPATAIVCDIVPASK